MTVEYVEGCLLCNARGIPLYDDLEDHLFGIAGHWSLLHCPGCGLAWLSPRPVAEDLGRIYKTYYTHSLQGPTRRRLLRESVRHQVLAREYGYELNPAGRRFRGLGWLLSYLPAIREIEGYEVMLLHASCRGRLLDVGSGNGRFLATMRDIGWDVEGLEIDERAATFARDTFGLPVTTGTLEDAAFPSNSFDVVTVNHVVEHLSHPIALLRECWRILIPGGHLIVVTPNLGSLLHRMFKSAWRGLEPPRHFTLFTLRSLEHCALRCGFTTEDIHSTARAARYLYTDTQRIRHRDHSLGSGKGASLRLRLESYAFQVLEGVGRRFVSTLGEEIFYMGRKPHDSPGSSSS